MNIQVWFPLRLIGLICSLSKGLSRVFSGTTTQKHQFFGAQSSLWSDSHICTWLLYTDVSFFLNTLSRFIIAYLPKSVCLLICNCMHALSLSCVRLFATPWTASHKAPLSMRFSRQEYWIVLSCPPPGDLPNPGIEPRSPALQANSLPSEPPGKPSMYLVKTDILDRVYLITLSGDAPQKPFYGKMTNNKLFASCSLWQLKLHVWSP